MPSHDSQSTDGNRSFVKRQVSPMDGQKKERLIHIVRTVGYSTGERGEGNCPVGPRNDGVPTRPATALATKAATQSFFLARRLSLGGQVGRLGWLDWSIVQRH